MVVSQELANFVDSVKVLVSASTSPHSPVAVTLKGVNLSATVRQRVKWTKFPVQPLIGPSRKPAAETWSWEVGDLHAPLHEAWSEWITRAEKALCTLHDIPEGEQTPYLGRASGYQLRDVQLQVSLGSTRKGSNEPCGQGLERARRPGSQGTWLCHHHPRDRP